ncbi:MAG: ankyrin repeat domain-containing protein [Acidobacteria bacterium]|nr:ankyrin repeat domain-containing protein [Acidobacteriota bacterium]
MERSALAFFILSVAALSVAQNTKPSQPVITLERTACLGSCPIYKLAIYKDGSTVYEGKEYVRIKGTETYRIEADAVRQLANKFVAARYFSFESKYVSIKTADGSEMVVTDLPSTYTSFTWEGHTKKIDDYVGGPRELRELEEEVDRAAKSSRYIRIDAETVHQKARQGWNVKEDPEAKGLLWEVVESGEADAVRAFLQEGANPNQNSRDLSLLQRARNADVVRVLIAGGADVNWKSSYGTALLSAASGDLDAVTALISAGAHVNETNSEGETALMKAASEAEPDICRLLLTSGANPSLLDQSGHSALDHAREGQKTRDQRKDDPFAEPIDPAQYQATLQVLSAATNEPAKKQ